MCNTSTVHFFIKGKDEKTKITLIRPFMEIHGHFKETKQLIKPGAVFVPPIKPKKRIKKVIKKEKAEDSDGEVKPKSSVEKPKKGLMVRSSSFRTKERETEVSLQFDKSQQNTESQLVRTTCCYF